MIFYILLALVIGYCFSDIGDKDKNGKVIYPLPTFKQIKAYLKIKLHQFDNWQRQN